MLHITDIPLYRYTDIYIYNAYVHIYIYTYIDTLFVLHIQDRLHMDRHGYIYIYYNIKLFKYVSDVPYYTNIPVVYLSTYFSALG